MTSRPSIQGSPYAVALFAAAMLCAATAAVADEVLILHPDLGEVVDAREAAAWNLFPDLPGLEMIVFVRTTSGGIVARVTVPGEDGPVVRERSLTGERWRAWRDRVADGRPVPSVAPPPPSAAATWPEVPMDSRTAFDTDAPPPIPAGDAVFDDAWLMILDMGYKRDTTRFRDYFTDMFVTDAAVGYALNPSVWPFLAFQAGIGDLQDRFEDITRNGKSAVYAIEAGVRLNTPISHRVDAALTLGGGYYMRQLRWGGEIFIGPYGYEQAGAAVREFADWGGSLRLGVQYALPSSEGKPHYLDVSVRYESYGADPVVLVDPETDAALLADDRDAWVAVTVGLVFGI